MNKSKSALQFSTTKLQQKEESDSDEDLPRILPHYKQALTSRFSIKHDLKPPAYNKFAETQPMKFKHWRSALKLPSTDFVKNTLKSYKTKQKVEGMKASLASIIEIFPSGYNQAQGREDSALGFGFLVSMNIIITSFSTLPNQNIARKAVFKFPSDLSNPFRFDPVTFHYCDEEGGFTVSAVSLGSRARNPIEARHRFILRVGAKVWYLGYGMSPKRVDEVDSAGFSFRSKSAVLPGMPIFTEDWKIQGIVGKHEDIGNQYKMSWLRIDFVLLRIKSITSRTLHGDLEVLLSEYEPIEVLSKKPAAWIEKNRFLYWAEWYTQNLLRYDTSLGRWNEVEINNLTEFLTDGRNVGWNFNWGSRLVVLPDATVFFIGGIGKNLTNIRDDVIHFIPNGGKLERKKSMIRQRECPSVVYRKGHLYAIGGRMAYSTCESYSITADRWGYIASLNLGRYNASTWLFRNEEYWYLVGGLPHDKVGTSIEKYSFAADIWNMIDIKLPNPMLNPGMFSVNTNKIAIIGGRYSKTVFVLDHVPIMKNGVEYEELRLNQVDRLDKYMETITPILHMEDTGLCYIVKGRSANDEPLIIEYEYKKFLKDNVENAKLQNVNLSTHPEVAKLRRSMLDVHQIPTYM